MNEVWVIAEQRLGKLVNVSLELLGKGVELAEKLDVKLAAVILGDGIQALTRDLMYYGADKVYLGEDARLRFYQSELYASLIVKLIETEKLQIVLVGATSIGQELAFRVAAKVRTGLTAHCVDLYIDEKNRLVEVVPGWGGSLMVQITCPEKRPQMATVSPGMIAKCARNERKKK